MASEELITIGSLLEEHGESEQEEEILERLKVLAQEHLPSGWTQWEVRKTSREEIFGDKLEPVTLNKLVFALPTVGIARAFDPEADHLSEKGYRAIRSKLLDWAFTRSLIISPPAISNKIRGSIGRTEFVKEAVEPVRPLLHTRAEADKILSGDRSESEVTSRKRRSSPSISAERPSKSRKTDSSHDRISSLEAKMERMFEMLLEKIESRPSAQPYEDSDKENDVDYTSDDSSWHVPNSGRSSVSMEQDEDFQFRPRVKEAEPLLPEPDPSIRKQGIECQRFGTAGWNRIRYKEAEKELHAAPIFSPLKVNAELGGLPQPQAALARQDGILGTIVHGLLRQQNTLAKALNDIKKSCPTVGEKLRPLLAEGSEFSTLSDHLLQFVCAHRSEVIEMRRKTFKAKNEALNVALHQIPPSGDAVFDEKQLASFIKDNGGLQQIFRFRPSKYPNPADRGSTFRKPAGVAHASRGRQHSERSRPSSSHKPSGRGDARRAFANAKPSHQNGRGNGRKAQRQRKY